MTAQDYSAARNCCDGTYIFIHINHVIIGQLMVSAFVNSAQVQVLSAALKVAQLDSPTDGSPTEDQPSSPTEGHADSDSPPPETKTAEVQVESEQNPTEEEQMVEPPPVPESCPVQEQGEMETQTEPQEGQEDSPPGSPVLVRDDSDHSSVVSLSNDPDYYFFILLIISCFNI